MSTPGEITRLLDQLAKEDDAGRNAVLQRLMPLVYGELKALARANRYRWQGPSVPGTTSLVHDAYVKLAAQTGASYAGRRQFFHVASRAMRSILVDNARWHQRQKRGGGHLPITLDEELLVSAQRSEELLALDEALGHLHDHNARLARIVECLCFGGLTTEETAEALDVSASTVKRGWSLARSWLYRELRTELP